MTAVRAKFKVYEITRMTRTLYRKDAQGKDVTEKVEGRTIKMQPVYSTDPAHENKAFWDATPSGTIELGIINPTGWAPFDLDREYYVDFTLAAAEQETAP